jgi:hypothetical protein
MSSHREAPEISKDPVADSSDLYAFVSPDNPDTVTILANYVPLQGPAGGPNFYEFGDDVLYEIHIDNDGDSQPDVTYQFRFTTQLQVGGTFLYNVGPITSLNSNTWNRRQFYSVTRVDWTHHNGSSKVLASKLSCPPCNIGPLSTPDYASLANQAVFSLAGGTKVFAGQRAEGFYVDLGAIFDLGDLRPFEQLHNQFGLAIPELTVPAPGVNATKAVNVHTIALQVPKSAIVRSGKPTIGVWTTASRQKARIQDDQGNNSWAGPYAQVSRLGNPLFNEVLVPMERKDYWNSVPPYQDSEFVDGVAHPELAKLLPILYPGVFPNLAGLVSNNTPRADLVAILLTGIPAGIVPGFTNFTGPVQADVLRLNTSIAPTANPNVLGLLGGDAAGFPNGRRVFDDVVTIEVRAIAGLTYPLVDSSFTADGAASLVDDGLTSSGTDLTARGTVQYLSSFPYLGTPHSGFNIPALADAHT